MTTPDIAGLCERLRAFSDLGSHYARTQAADTLERQAAENKRLREALGQIVEGTAVQFGSDGHPEANAIARAALTGEDTATLSLSGKTQTKGDACIS
jgi:hypothetical protein